MAAEPPSPSISTQQRVAALFEIRRQQAQLQAQRRASSNDPKSPVVSNKSVSNGSLFPMGPQSTRSKDVLPSALDPRKEREARRQKLVERQKERAELAKQRREEKRRQDAQSSFPSSPMSDKPSMHLGDDTDEYDDTTIRLPNRRKPSDGSINSSTSSVADAAAQKTLQTLQNNRNAAQQRRPSLEMIAEKTEVEHLQKQLSAMTKRCAEMKEQLEFRNEYLAKMEQKQETILAEKNDLTEEVTILTLDLQRLRGQHEEQEKEQERLLAENANFQKLNQDLRQDISDRAANRKSIMVTHRENPGSLDEDYVAAMEEELDLLTIDRDEWKAKAEAKRRSSFVDSSDDGETDDKPNSDALQRQLRNVQDELSVYEVQNQGLLEIVEKCQTREDELTKQIESLTTDTSKVDTLSAELEEVKDHLAACELDKKVSLERVEQSQQQIVLLKEEVAKLTSLLDEAAREQDKLVDELKAAKHTASDVDRLRLQLTEIKQDFQEALEEEESKRAQAESEVRQLKSAMSNSNTQASAVGPVHARRAAPPPPAAGAGGVRSRRERKPLENIITSPSEAELMDPSYKPKTLEEAKARRERLRAARANAR